MESFHTTPGRCGAWVTMRDPPNPTKAGITSLEIRVRYLDLWVVPRVARVDIFPHLDREGHRDVVIRLRVECLGLA